MFSNNTNVPSITISNTTSRNLFCVPSLRPPQLHAPYHTVRGQFRIRTGGHTVARRLVAGHHVQINGIYAICDRTADALPIEGRWRRHQRCVECLRFDAVQRMQGQCVWSASGVHSGHGHVHIGFQTTRTRRQTPNGCTIRFHCRRAAGRNFLHSCHARFDFDGGFDFGETRRASCASLIALSTRTSPNRCSRLYATALTIFQASGRNAFGWR